MEKVEWDGPAFTPNIYRSNIIKEYIESGKIIDIDGGLKLISQDPLTKRVTFITNKGETKVLGNWSIIKRIRIFEGDGRLKPRGSFLDSYVESEIIIDSHGIHKILKVDPITYKITYIDVQGKKKVSSYAVIRTKIRDFEKNGPKVQKVREEGIIQKYIRGLEMNSHGIHKILAQDLKAKTVTFIDIEGKKCTGNYVAIWKRVQDFEINGPKKLRPQSCLHKYVQSGEIIDSHGIHKILSLEPNNKVKYVNEQGEEIICSRCTMYIKLKDYKVNGPKQLKRGIVDRYIVSQQDVNVMGISRIVSRSGNKKVTVLSQEGIEVEKDYAYIKGLLEEL